MNGPTAKQLVAYAQAQGVTATEDAARTAYEAWAKTHQRDAASVHNAHHLQNRDVDACAWPHCRDVSTIIYRAGSTELTRTRDAGLCDQHLEEFCRALGAIRGQTD